MGEETTCYFHNEITTRLSCVNCGKNICPKCMVEAAVGFKCPECAHANETHIEKIARQDYITGGLASIIIGAGAGYIWYQLSMYGILISLLVAYAVGFCVSKSISLSIGNKIGRKVEIFAGTIAVISIMYNPVIFFGSLLNGADFFILVIISTASFFSLFRAIAVVIAVWAAIRHFRM